MGATRQQGTNLVNKSKDRRCHRFTQLKRYVKVSLLLNTACVNLIALSLQAKEHEKGMSRLERK